MSGDKLDPFIERSETLEKMGAERPGVLVYTKMRMKKRKDQERVSLCFILKIAE